MAAHLRLHSTISSKRGGLIVSSAASLGDRSGLLIRRAVLVSLTRRSHSVRGTLHAVSYACSGREECNSCLLRSMSSRRMPVCAWRASKAKILRHPRCHDVCLAAGLLSPVAYRLEICATARALLRGCSIAACCPLTGRLQKEERAYSLDEKNTPPHVAGGLGAKIWRG
jgi:hypothetical protein